MRKVLLSLAVFAAITAILPGDSQASSPATTTLEISGDTLILSYPDSRQPVIFRREGGNSGSQIPPMKIDIPGTWTLKTADSAPDISRNSLWPGVVGADYSYTLRTDKPRATWSAHGLPKGLSVSSAGKISGRPTESGTFSVDVTAETNAGKSSQVFTLKIFADSKPAVVTETLPEANVNASYDFTLKMNDSPAPVIMAAGLPEGLTVDSSGKISGRPARPGDYTVNITAANDAGESSSSLALKVSSRDIPKPKPAPKPAPKPRPRNIPRISTSSLKQAFTGEDYSFNLKASGKNSVTWKADRLPEGLTLNPETGEISGRPSADFKGKITFTASNSEGSASRAISFSIRTKKPRIITSLLPEGFTGVDYRTELKAEGGQGITWEFRGKIPEGLSFSRSGVLEGVPEKAGRFSLNASAVNTGGKASRRFTLRVSGGAKLDYVTAAVLPAVTVSADGKYDFPVSIDAGIPAGSYIVWHSFPYGIESDGEIYEFKDSDGKETITVPENHSVVVSAWLEGGVRYEPVITARVREDTPEESSEPVKPSGAGAEVSGEIQGSYSGCNASGIAGALILLSVMARRSRGKFSGRL